MAALSAREIFALVESRRSLTLFLTVKRHHSGLETWHPLGMQPLHRQSILPHQFVLLERVARLNNLAFIVAGTVIWSYTFLLIIEVGPFRATTALHRSDLNFTQWIRFIQRAARLVTVFHSIVINHSLGTLLRWIFAKEINWMYGLFCAIIAHAVDAAFCILVATNVLFSNYKSLSPSGLR